MVVGRSPFKQPQGRPHAGHNPVIQSGIDAEIVEAQGKEQF